MLTKEFSTGVCCMTETNIDVLAVSCSLHSTFCDAGRYPMLDPSQTHTKKCTHTHTRTDPLTRTHTHTHTPTQTHPTTQTLRFAK